MLTSQLFIKHPYTIGIISSLLISILLINLNPLFNTDAVLYLRAAEAFNIGGLDAAIELYPRPFYSMLIGLIQQVSGCTIINAAYWLNTLLFTILISAFVATAGIFTDKKNIYLIAILTIIPFAGINEYRHYIIRDVGYWAFALVAISCFFRHYLNLRISFFFGWVAATVIATLFRPEAIILLLLPLCRLVDIGNTNQQLKRYYSQILGGGLCLLLIIVAADLTLQTHIYTGIIEVINRELQTFHEIQSERFIETSNRVANQILNRFSAEYAQPVLMTGLLYIFFAKLFGLLGPVYLVATGIAIFLARRLTIIPRTILFPYLFSIILVTLPVLTFLANRQFLQARYTMLIALTLILIIPALLNILHEKYHSHFCNVWKKLGLVILLLYVFIDSLVSFGHSKNYMLEGISWLQTNASKNDSIYSNNAQLVYLSGLKTNWKDSREFQYSGVINPASRYSFWAVKINRKNQALQSVMQHKSKQLTKVASFANERGDKLVIYQPKVVRKH